MAKIIGFVKAYWICCLENKVITTPKIIDLPRVMQRGNKAKSRKNKTEKKANIAYTVSDCWQLHAGADRKDKKLADFILLGMYTVCSIG